MAAWQFAGDVPGLLFERTARLFSQTGVRSAVTSGQGRGSFPRSTSVGLGNCSGRSLVLVIGFLLIIPVPWALVW